MRAFADGNELLFGRHSRRVNRVISCAELVAYGCDANHKKFIEIGCDDREKFDSFKYGVFICHSLHHDAVIEFQPAQFAVDVMFRQDIDGCHKKAAPFSIVFGNKKIPAGNINPNNINNKENQDIKKKQSNKFSHQSPLRYNRPFQNNNFNMNMNSKYKNKSNIYSVFIKNYLDSSHLYDLHKANWDVTQPNIPTAKLRKIKLGNPFAVGTKHKTNFGHVYSAGGIPCRIEHGNVNMKLVWSIPPESLEYDPTLIICFEGLLETLHPYSFAAKQCVRELLSAKGAQEKVIPILGRLIPHLKNALVCDNPDTFLEAMNVVEMLSDLVGDLMNPYLHFFLQSINKRSFNLKYKERVFDLMRTLESNGGPEALVEIKKKVPTYMSSV